MSFNLDLNQETIGIVIVVSILVAAATEFIKQQAERRQKELTNKQIELITLLLGLLFSFVGLLIFNYEFVTFVGIALVGTYGSSGIYEGAKNLLFKK